MTPDPSSPPHMLLCHPATPAGRPLHVAVAVNWSSAGLHLRYSVSGDTTALLLPPATRSGAADGLWQHTCLEAFVAREAGESYEEFNFSPSGQWAAYRFASERQRDTPTEAMLLAPRMRLEVTPSQLTLDVHLAATALPSSAAALRLGLCAVIEELDGRLSYWALTHPHARPDFHHPAGRCLRLALP